MFMFHIYNITCISNWVFFLFTSLHVITFYHFVFNFNVSSLPGNVYLNLTLHLVLILSFVRLSLRLSIRNITYITPCKV